MEISVKPIKKFFTSLYYANKKLEYAPNKKFKFGEDASENLIARITPYMEGYEQLANKYNFNMYANSCGNRDFIVADENMINVQQNMTAPEIARKVYQRVSESLKERNLI